MDKTDKLKLISDIQTQVISNITALQTEYTKTIGLLIERIQVLDERLQVVEGEVMKFN